MIDDAEMTHLKLLARLELPEDETAMLKDDLNKILEAFEQIRGLDTEGVDELTRPIDSVNVFRKDRPGRGLSQKESLALAVEKQDEMFKVPRTVDQ